MSRDLQADINALRDCLRSLIEKDVMPLIIREAELVAVADAAFGTDIKKLVARCGDGEIVNAPLELASSLVLVGIGAKRPEV